MDNNQLEGSDLNLIQHKKTSSKVPNGTVTRNFFEIEDIEDDDFNQASSPTKLIEQKVEQANNSPSKQSKRKFRNLKLKPLQTADPQVIDFNKANKKIEENPQRKEEKKQIKTNGKKTKLNFEISSSDDEQQIMQINRSTHPKKQQHKKQNNNNSSNVFLSESVDLPEVEPERAAESDQQSGQATSPPNPANNSQVDNSRSLNISHCRTYIMKRDKQWLNKIWPQFNLYTKSENQYTFSAKLTGNNKETTFTICESADQFVQNGPKYLGKVKTNFIGNIINVYGPGYNPSDYKNKKLPIRELLATVEYETNFFGSTRPRNFKVFVLKNKISYYDDLEGPVRGEDEIPLNQLIDRGDNKRKILVLQNRKPSWNEGIKGYMLYFGGRIKKASIKNFILEDEDHPETTRLIFGKLDEDQFRLDIGAPFSPLVGFGIALSTFGGKIGCE